MRPFQEFPAPRDFKREAAGFQKRLRDNDSLPVPRTHPLSDDFGHQQHTVTMPFDQPTPSFFCRLEDDVVYWKTSRLSG
jgi:hypothetical protein